jgi:hypothetical protein
MMNISFGICPTPVSYIAMLGMSFTHDSMFNLSRRNVLAAMFVHSSSFITLTCLYRSASVFSQLVVAMAVWCFVLVLRILEKQRGLPGALAGQQEDSKGSAAVQ